MVIRFDNHLYPPLSDEIPDILRREGDYQVIGSDKPATVLHLSVGGWLVREIPHPQPKPRDFFWTTSDVLLAWLFLLGLGLMGFGLLGLIRS